MLCNNDLVIQSPPFVVNGQTYDGSIETTMSDADLASLGLFKVIDDGAPNDAFTAVSSCAPARQADGTIRMVYVLRFVSVKPQVISKRQLMQQCVVNGDITVDEAIAFFKDGTFPAKFETAFAQIPNDGLQQSLARLTFLSAGSIVRTNPTTLQLQLLLGKSDADMDALFTAANLIV